MSRKNCQFCHADWSMYSEDPDSDVLGFRLRGLNTCCTPQMRYWIKNKSRLNPTNRDRVLSELGLA